MSSSLFSRSLLKRSFSSQLSSAYSAYKTSTYFGRDMTSTGVKSKAGYATSSLPTNEPVVSADWLHSNLKEANIKVLDASWYMPYEQRSPFQDYQISRVPGALFFDLNGISDRTTNLPQMLPSVEAFAAGISALGIENKDGVVVYDRRGIYSAARIWWMFRVFGHDKVWVLDGGLPRWHAAGYEYESSVSSDAISKSNAASEAVEKVYQGQTVSPITFQTKFRPHLVWGLDQIKENMETKTHQHIDVRAKDRFDGTVPELRKGMPSGHIPGSKSLHFPHILDSCQRLLPAEELRKRFEQENIAVDRPIVVSCGTGVTACIMAMGFHRLGKTDVPIFDGSWTEWATNMLGYSL